MVRSQSRILFILCLFILGACASKMKNQMKAYRDAFALGEFDKASLLLEASVLKKDKKSVLLWHLEKGTVASSLGKHDAAISHFQTALDLIDKLYTTKLTSKASSLLINDASDDFYGASYERSFAHYFLARAYYQRYQISKNKLDLQGARGTILAWDSYFASLQRSASYKTLYHTDLMLKVFGGEVHEVSEIRGDKQIALQLYKDALKILDTEGGVFSLFNKKSVDFIKAYEAAIKEGKAPPAKLYEETSAHDDLKEFLTFKILALTKDVRGSDFQGQVKALKPSAETLKRVNAGPGNVVLILEEGLIPAKLPKPFNIGLKGAAGLVKNDGAKKFIMTVGAEALTLFAMNKLNLAPTQTAGPGSFLFAHDVTKLAVQEAAIEFELPMIDNVPLVQRLQVFVLDEKGVVVSKTPLPVVTENGDIARIVLEEDVVARYVKTGTRVAVRHILAIVAAMQVYNQLNSSQGDFLGKTAAMATYIGASKGIAALEKADVRHWTTLPQAIRMTELKLPAGKYKVAIASYSGDKAPEAPAKILGDIVVNPSGKTLQTLRFSAP